MRKVNLLALLILAAAIGDLHAESLRSGGCSDLYGAVPNREASRAEGAKHSQSRVRLVSTNGGDSAVHLVGCFRKGGCTNGFVPSSATFYQAPAVTCYQAPAANYFQEPNALAHQSVDCTSVGNVVINYGNSIQSDVSNSYGAIVVPTEQRSLMDCGPVNSYKVVLEPKYFTESRAVCATEYQNETRYRTRVVARTVPVETQDYKTITVMVPRSETKTIEYTVLVLRASERTVDVVDTVPVWTEVSEQYTVKVPQVIDVPEEYKIRVAQLADQEFTYTVQVPQSMSETRMQAVTSAVPVTKTRTVQICQPVTRVQSVIKDYGHWEDRVEEVNVAAPSAGVCNNAGSHSAPAVYAAPVVCAAPSYGCGGHHGCRLFRRGGCGTSAGCGAGREPVGGCGCGSAQVVYAQPSLQTYCEPAYAAPTTQTVTRRVWVPNIVNEEVTVVENVSQSQEVAYTVFEQKTEQVPYEVTYLVYLPETRSGTRKVVNYVEESRTRNRKVVQYNDEARTRTRRQLSYKQETRTETIPVVSYTNEKRTKEVSFTFNVPETRVEPFTATRFETVNEEVSEAYTVSVPVATTKEVQVQVCRMVPKLVPVTIYPCAETQPVGGCADGCGGSATLSPALPSSGCNSGCVGCQ